MAVLSQVNEEEILTPFLIIAASASDAKPWSFSRAEDLLGRPSCYSLSIALYKTPKQVLAYMT